MIDSVGRLVVALFERGIVAGNTPTSPTDEPAEKEAVDPKDPDTDKRQGTVPLIANLLSR